MVWGKFFPRLPGGVRACQDGFGHFFSTFARLTEEGGSKAIWAMPIWKQNISKNGFQLDYCFLTTGKKWQVLWLTPGWKRAKMDIRHKQSEARN